MAGRLGSSPSRTAGRMQKMIHEEVGFKLEARGSYKFHNKNWFFVLSMCLFCKCVGNFVCARLNVIIWFWFVGKVNLPKLKGNNYELRLFFLKGIEMGVLSHGNIIALSRLFGVKCQWVQWTGDPLYCAISIILVHDSMSQNSGCLGWNALCWFIYSRGFKLARNWGGGRDGQGEKPVELCLATFSKVA